jgi:hypothetical protein
VIGSADLTALARPVYDVLFPRTSKGRRIVQSLRLTASHVVHARKLGRALRLYAPRLAPHGDLAGRRIVVLAYKFPWLDVCTGIAVALAARGATVRIAWLPQVSPLPLSEATMAVAERAVARAYRSAFPRDGQLAGIDLEARVPAEVPPSLDAFFRTLASVDAKYVARASTIDVTPGGPNRGLFEFRQARARRAYGLARSLIEHERFDSAIIPNGSMFEFAAFARACGDAGLDYVTFEFWERERTCVLNLNRPFFDGFDADLWRAAPKTLDPMTRARVARSMAVREGTEWRGYLLKYQTAEAGPADALRRELGLDARLPIVLVLPNVAYDSSVAQIPSGFSSMREWLVVALRLLARRGDCQVVVRAHPGETLIRANETTEQIVKESLPRLPAHIRFVPPLAKMNTYALMKMSALGLVFTSTTGLELAMRGVPVIVAARMHYCDRGFTIRADGDADLAAKIDACLRVPRTLAPREIETAWLYADMFMNRWPRPFPFNLERDFWRDSRSIVESLVAGTCAPGIRDTITLFGGGARARELYDKLLADPDEALPPDAP